MFSHFRCILQPASPLIAQQGPFCTSGHVQASERTPRIVICNKLRLDNAGSLSKAACLSLITSFLSIHITIKARNDDYQAVSVLCVANVCREVWQEMPLGSYRESFLFENLAVWKPQSDLASLVPSWTVTS